MNDKRIIIAAIEQENMSGVYNATCPAPVTNAEFMRGLRRALHRPWTPPVPAWLARIGAALMRTEAELALTGRRCIPARLAAERFRFQHVELPATLNELYS